MNLQLHYQGKVFTFYWFLFCLTVASGLWYVTKISHIKAVLLPWNRGQIFHSPIGPANIYYIINVFFIFKVFFYLHCWIDLRPSQTRIPVIPWRSVKVCMVSKMHLKHIFKTISTWNFIHLRLGTVLFVWLELIWSWKYPIVVFIGRICSDFLVFF